MPAILVSVKKDTWKKMKKHPEIKWTQVAREGIEGRLDELEGIVPIEKVREWIGPERLAQMRKGPRRDPQEMHKKLKESEWRRQELLTRLRSSKARKG